MRFEHFDQALVLARVVVVLLQFVARRSKCAGWRVTQGADRSSRLLARIDQILVERAHDAVAPGVELANFALVLAAGFDNATSRCIDDGGDPAGLGIKGVARTCFGHNGSGPRCGWKVAAKDSGGKGIGDSRTPLITWVPPFENRAIRRSRV